jgi:hypothetical protein
MDLTLSPTSINLYRECPRCFWLQVNKKIKRPEGPFPSLPGGMDLILKRHFDAHRMRGTLPEDLQGIAGSLFQDMEHLSVWRNNLRGLRYTNPESKVTLMGALDDLLVTPEGLYVPLDFKTRGYPPKETTPSYYQHQMDLYTYLLQKNGYQTAGHAYLLFYHPKEIIISGNVEFYIDPVKVVTSPERAEQLFSRCVCTLLNDIPEPTADCKFCSWMNSVTKL